MGSIESEPVITIYGKGTITININGCSFLLREISDYIVVDSKLKNAYRKAELMNTHMEGEFPVFDVGWNKVTWTGDVTRMEINAYWRWL